MSKKRKSIIIFSFLGILLFVFCLFYFQTPSLDANKINKLTIGTLPSPPKEKTITKMGDIEKFVTYFNSLHLSPRLGISMPAGTTCWIKIPGELYAHDISITGNIIQFDKRLYTANNDISNDIQRLYQSFSYQETEYIPSVSAYSALEKDLSQKFGENKEKYEILSYDVSSFDNSADSIKAVISYYDKSKKSKTNLAIYTSHGIGCLDLAGGSKDFEVLDNEKVKIASNSTVCIALKNISKNEIINYEVKYTYDPTKNEDKFTVSANKRGAKA